MNGKQADVAVIIGRFQPFHNGHAALLRQALAAAPRVLVALGTAYHARTPREPFTWQERAAMIAVNLSEAEQQRVTCMPLRDYYDDVRWSEALLASVAAHAGPNAAVTLVGHFGDGSSYYVNQFPEWELAAASHVPDVEAAQVRQALFEAEDVDVALTVLQGQLPLAVRRYLKAWSVLPHLARLVEEHRHLQAYRALWRGAPYPPIFVTVDALVLAAGHVLLVRRGAYPGKDLWALPGGFLDQNERLRDAAIRELREETGLGILQASLVECLRDVQVYDHPERSLRGRTVTHVHLFDLRLDTLPEVQGADDAAAAEWVAVADLLGMEDRFHDDHFNILDDFLRLTHG